MVMSERETRVAVADLYKAIIRLEAKVDACNGFCEAILDEVVPINLALEALADAPAVT